MNKLDPKIQQEAQTQRQKDSNKFDALMAPLFKEAREKGLWFYTNYQGMWFAPCELEAEHAAGRLRWGPDNWKLRDPQEMIKAMKAKRKQIKKDIAEVEKRIAREAEINVNDANT